MIPSVTDRWLFQIRFDHLDHFVGGHCLLRSGFLPFRQARDSLCGPPAVRPSSCSWPSGCAHHLQNSLKATALFGENPHEGFYPPLNAFSPQN